MSTDNRIIPGIVKDGVIVPKSENQLPEGTEVEIVVRGAAMTPELRDELAAWQAAGGEAWAMIDQWRKKIVNNGDIHWVDLPVAGGREQRGRRPAIIIQDEKVGEKLPTVLVVPLTSSQRAMRFAAR